MSFLPDISNIISTYGYLGIFTTVFLESGIFFALPGDSLLFTAGLVDSAYGLHVWILVPLVFVATFLGGLVGYYIGTRLDHLYKYSFFRRFIKKDHLDKTHKFFEKHGKYTVIFSRFVPVVRTFTPIVAGIAGMRRTQFIKYSLVSSALWSATIILSGYYLGKIFPSLINYLHYVIIIILFVSILPGIIKYVGHLRSRKNKN